jgi:acyl-CoA synthetase (AMP-forming)/AMP-acid ligase II
VLSPANPAYTVEELAFQLKDANAKALCTQVEFLPTAVKAAQLAGIDKEMIILMGDQRMKDASFKHFTSIRNISGATRYRKAKVAPGKDLAFLVYSSGTTGLPKGVMLTHENITSNLMQLRAAESGHLSWQGGPSGKGDRILAFLPFYHIYGKNISRHVFRTSAHLLPNRIDVPHHAVLRSRLGTSCHAQVRDRALLPNYPGVPSIFRLYSSSNSLAASQTPHCLKIQPLLITNGEQRSSTVDS